MDPIMLMAIFEIIVLCSFLLCSSRIKNSKKWLIYSGLGYLLAGEALFLFFYRGNYFIGAFLQDLILFLLTLGGYFLLLLGLKEVLR